MALADYQALIAALIRDDEGVITTTQRDQALAAAVVQVSRDQPRALVHDVTIAGGGQVMGPPAGFALDTGIIRTLEYPIGQVPPVLIEGWQIYVAPSSTSIILPAALPMGAVVRVNWLTAHTLDGATDTIPAKARQAVASWAAAILLDQLAARASAQTDSTIQADRVERGSSAREYAQRARDLRKAYYAGIGIEPGRKIAAGTVVSLPQTGSSKQPRLLH